MSRTVTLIGRYLVHKHRDHWDVVARHARGEFCVSSHGSHATACAAAKRYDAADRRRGQDYSEAVKRFV